MNFKRYHVSKNLFDISAYYTSATGISDIVTTTNSITYTASSAYLAIRYFFPLDTTDIFTINLGSESSKVRLELRYRKNGASVGDAIVVTIGNSYVIRGSEDVDEIQIYISNGTNTGTCKASNIMLNTGSEPLPYEPYSSEVWHDIPYYQHKTATDTLTLPAVIYPNDTSITVGLKGNEEHTGTPSPQNPVVISGTGDRTGNLCLVSQNNCITYANFANYVISNNSITSTGQALLGFKCKVESNTSYAISIKKNTSADLRIREYSSEPTEWETDFVIQSLNTNQTSATFTTSQDTKWILVAFWFSTAGHTVYDIMLNLGSEALPYEPYGYKIPILLNSQTINKYLGEEQTERQIKKLMLTGKENWSRVGDAVGQIPYFRIAYFTSAKPMDVVCTHYISPNRNISVSNQVEGTKVQTSSEVEIMLIVRPPEFAVWSVDDFKLFLAQQYAAGTPVTVWYVLAEPETAVVNEPLMKIGDYADTLSNVSIPVVAGENTLDVQTTVQSSEVTATFEGWHPVQSTHEKSRNLFDKDLPNTTTIGYIREDGTIGENNNYAVSNYIELQANTQYTVSNMNVNGLYPGICFYDSSKTYISGIKYNGETSLTFTTPADCKYVLMSYLKTNNDIVMLNSGSTALPYESYWK